MKTITELAVTHHHMQKVMEVMSMFPGFTQDEEFLHVKAEVDKIIEMINNQASPEFINQESNKIQEYMKKRVHAKWLDGLSKN